MPMKTSCLINSYNYRRFVGEAIEGALSQTHPFDEVIIVDDGSTDGSPEMLNTEYGGRPNVTIIAKKNQGQLSCFNEGFARATGDILFFLDADDVYQPDYVESALEVYRRQRDCDFLFTGRHLFGKEERDDLAYPEDRDLGYSVILTLFRREWIGAATSCLSMRRQVLEDVLPLPFENDWRSRADDCLVFGASLAARGSVIWPGRSSGIACMARTPFMAGRMETMGPPTGDAWPSTGCSSTSSDGCRTRRPNWPTFHTGNSKPSIALHSVTSWPTPTLAWARRFRSCVGWLASRRWAATT